MKSCLALTVLDPLKLKPAEFWYQDWTVFVISSWVSASFVFSSFTGLIKSAARWSHFIVLRPLQQTSPFTPKWVFYGAGSGLKQTLVMRMWELKRVRGGGVEEQPGGSTPLRCMLHSYIYVCHNTARFPWKPRSLGLMLPSRSYFWLDLYFWFGDKPLEMNHLIFKRALGGNVHVEV